MKTIYQASLAAAIATVTISPNLAYATNGYQLIGVGSYQKEHRRCRHRRPRHRHDAPSPILPAWRGLAPARISIWRPVHAGPLCRFRRHRRRQRRQRRRALWHPGTRLDRAGERRSPDLYFGGGMYGTSGLGADYAQHPLDRTLIF